MNRTKIEWVKNPDGTQGYTWNPITGCLNQDNGLCKGGGFPCYAYRLANGRLKPLYLANTNTVMKFANGYESMNLNVTEPFHPRFWEERLEDSLFITKSLRARLRPRGIFVCDMGELFGDWIPKKWQEEIFLTIRNNPQHRFYLLTKQPQNLIKFSPFPENCWVGVTATSLQMFNKAMFNLQRIEAKVKYISFEPLLEQTNMASSWLTLFGKPIINWLIIGAQTNPYKPPKIAWVREIVEAADKAGIKVFLKDNLLPLIAGKGTPEGLFYKDIWFRQEMP